MVSSLGSARVCAGVPLAFTIVLTAILAGCGGSSSSDSIASKSAAEILTASRTAALGASSVHVVDKSSQDQGRLSRTLDLELTGNGGRVRTSFLGRTSESIRIGDTLYVKRDPAYYKSLARRGLHVTQGAWLKQPASEPLETDLSGMLNLLLKSAEPLTKGATTTIDGQQVIELRQRGKLYTGSIYIATTGQHYPIEIVKHGRETGLTTFTGWNDPVTITPPAHAIALQSLEHQAKGQL